MPRYIALLRGVMPTNCRMPALKASFESAGFTDVRTLLSSGNVAFTARTAAIPTLERRAEQAMLASFGHSFLTIIRTRAHLEALVASDPYAGFTLPLDAKRIVTFLKDPGAPAVALPIEREGSHILHRAGSEVFGAYERTPKGAVFMTLIESAFGKEITTRTLGTVEKCSRA